jgi:hypothetical protein
MLAPLSGAEMFQNRINGLVPNLFAPTLNTALLAKAGAARAAEARGPQSVHIADIYQAALNRAIEDHELDKLFNPDFYDYQI